MMGGVTGECKFTRIIYMCMCMCMCIYIYILCSVCVGGGGYVFPVHLIFYASILTGIIWFI